jgi:hypothetical protein
MPSYKGRYYPKFPKKYKGDASNIIWRSLWEKRVMKYLDENTSVIEWQSEELRIPYRSPVDGKRHSYYPDFLAKVKQPDGTVKTLVLEVKPEAQTREPKVQARHTRKYITEVMTWGVNRAKWRSAQLYCEEKGYSFIILSENALGIK